MMKLEKYKKDCLLFIEAGFIAINQADEPSAISLFSAAELLNQNNPLIKLGLGYLHLHKLELKQAIEKFEAVLKEDPKNELAKVFLGIAMSWSPADTLKGEKILKDSSKSKDKHVKDLSTYALEFVDNFIKKAPSPVEIKGGKKK